MREMLGCIQELENSEGNECTNDFGLIPTNDIVVSYGVFVGVH